MSTPHSPDQSLAAIELENYAMIDDTPLIAAPSDYRGLHYPLGKWVPEAGQLHEIADGVHWFRMPLPMSLDHINLYVLDDGDDIAIVDTGINSDVCRKQWEQILDGPLAGRRVSRVIATHYHPDHLGLAGWLCARFNAPLWISRAEFLLARTLTLDSQSTVPEEAVRFYARTGWTAASLELLKASGWGNFSKIAAPLPLGYIRMKAGDVLRIGAYDWTCVPGNGHSPEHICLHQPRLGVLISGDQLLPRITSNVSVYTTEPEANPLQDWFDSLDRLEAMPPETLVLPAHNEPFTGVQVRTKQLRDDHQSKLDRLLEHIKAAPRTAIECFEILFKRKLSGRDYVMATGEALAHLRYLEERFLISRRMRDAAVEYYVAG
jgi:glyoxylase-like metal-dependent hydrolase (beta-lactamase superfamily II)